MEREQITPEVAAEVKRLVEESKNKREVHRFRKKWTVPVNGTPNLLSIWQEIGKTIYNRLDEKKQADDLGAIKSEFDVIYMSVEQWEEIERILDIYDRVRARKR